MKNPMVLVSLGQSIWVMLLFALREAHGEGRNEELSFRRVALEVHLDIQEQRLQKEPDVQIGSSGISHLWTVTFWMGWKARGLATDGAEQGRLEQLWV